ncbi:unnamed protein product [Amaranthus hypochondriacus]
MEVSMFTNFNDHMEIMDDINLIHDDELQVNSFEEIFEPSLLCEYTIHNHDHHHTNHHTMIKPDQNPINQQLMMNNTNHWNNSSYDDHYHDGLMSSSIQDYYYTCNNSSMLSFGNTSNDNQNIRFGAQLPTNSEGLVAKQGSKKSSASMAKFPTQVPKLHILAERKRREKLNQRFIALSAIIPGLKKMDKATVLEDAVRYVKELQQEVKTLEEETKRKTIESAMLLGSTSSSRSSLLSNQEQDQNNTYYYYSSNIQDYDDDDDDDDDDDEGCPSSILEMEARFSYKDVLIRIHCQNKNGILQDFISHIEKLHLLVINSSALLFGPASLDATIIAQMGGEFSMTAKDLVRHLHAALLKRQLM